MTGSGSKSKTGKKHYYYHCNPRKGCNERYRAETAHESLNKIFKKLKPDKDVCELFELVLKDKFENSEKSNKTLIESLSKKIERVRNRKNSLLDKFIDESISKEVYSNKDKELSNEIIDYENQISQLNNYEKDTKKFIDYGLYVLKNLSSFFNNATVLTKQKILSSIFKEKLVFRDGEYRTPILNFGIELIYKSINVLEDNLNKNRRQSSDYLPLSTLTGTRTQIYCLGGGYSIQLNYGSILFNGISCINLLSRRNKSQLSLFCFSHQNHSLRFYTSYFSRSQIQ